MWSCVANRDMLPLACPLIDSATAIVLSFGAESTLSVDSAGSLLLTRKMSKIITADATDPAT